MTKSMNPPSVLVVIVLIELLPLDRRVLQLVPERTEQPLERMTHEYNADT